LTKIKKKKKHFVCNLLFEKKISYFCVTFLQDINHKLIIRNNFDVKSDVKSDSFLKMLKRFFGSKSA